MGETPPPHEQGARGASTMAGWLSVREPRPCSLGFLPLSLMFYSCKPSLRLSSEGEEEGAGGRELEGLGRQRW